MADQLRSLGIDREFGIGVFHAKANSLRELKALLEEYLVTATPARWPSTSGRFRRRIHETKTSLAPHSSSDAALRAGGRICDDFAGGCIRHLLSLYCPALPHLSGRSPSCGSLARSTAPRSAYPRLAGSVAVTKPATGHDHTRQLCHLPALHAGRTCLDPATAGPCPSARSWRRSPHGAPSAASPDSGAGSTHPAGTAAPQRPVQ